MEILWRKTTITKMKNSPEGFNTKSIQAEKELADLKIGPRHNLVRSTEGKD